MRGFGIKPIDATTRLGFGSRQRYSRNLSHPAAHGDSAAVLAAAPSIFFNKSLVTVVCPQHNYALVPLTLELLLAVFGVNAASRQFPPSPASSNFHGKIHPCRVRSADSLFDAANLPA
jgi:hypothetical protein